MSQTNLGPIAPRILYSMADTKILRHWRPCFGRFDCKCMLVLLAAFAFGAKSGRCKLVQVSTLEQFLASWQDESVDTVELAEDVPLLRSHSLSNYIRRQSLIISGNSKNADYAGLLTDSPVCGLYVAPNVSLFLMHVRLVMPPPTNAKLSNALFCQAAGVELHLINCHVVLSVGMPADMLLDSVKMLPRPLKYPGQQILYDGPCWYETWTIRPRWRRAGLLMVDCAFEFDVDEPSVDAIHSGAGRRIELVRNTWFDSVEELSAECVRALGVHQCLSELVSSLSRPGFQTVSRPSWPTFALVALVFAIMGGIYFSRRHLFLPARNTALSVSAGLERHSGPEIFPALVLGKVIGTCSSGIVRHARWDGMLVAVMCCDTAPLHPDTMNAILALRHPNVLRTFHIMAPHQPNRKPLLGGPAWIVQELCDEGNLAMTLQNRLVEADHPHATLGIHFVLLRALDIARGLSYLHALRIQHGNVQAESTRLCSCAADPFGCTAKLADFELSRVLSSDSPTHPPMPALRLSLSATAELNWADPATPGTITHAAPELLRDGWAAAGLPADVYAFGVLLYELVRGCAPYPGLARQEVAARVAGGKLRPTLPAHVPEEYCMLAAQCWQQRQDSRPAMKEVEQKLSDMLARVGELQRHVDDNLASVNARLSVW